METLGERLGYLLKEELCIYPSALNKALGRSNNYVSNIINGHNKKPSPKRLDYLQYRYNVNPAWLLYGKGDIFLNGGKQDNYSIAQWFHTVEGLSPENQTALWEFVELLKIRDKYNRLIKDMEDKE